MEFVLVLIPSRQDFYNNTDDTPRIGGEGGTGTREFDGYIQDLRVYKGVPKKYKSGFDVCQTLYSNEFISRFYNI